MTAKQIVDELEMRGVLVSLHPGGEIKLHAPGFSEGMQPYIQAMKESKPEVVAFLQAREDRKTGFAPATGEGIYQLAVSMDRPEAVVLLMEAIQQGLAVLEGKVIYTMGDRVAEICFQPLVPMEWLKLPDKASIRNITKQPTKKGD